MSKRGVNYLNKNGKPNYKPYNNNNNKIRISNNFSDI